ncbi:thiosulfate oxidation carrier complex protein SoxZ [Candidatus Methylospira mobilis]|uniref:Thiosulfate oxidation carrier complex protein SoxZ n=1 Tax=Candidatus Methylospira mobilis TaxID=1808979 RepID=A0A5Q0BH10_9GAMM|nr:thiosulfate oxidation carrier complex protein SoxZ [Candidatus Methylospira mobilis]QFY43113.1 thiosulfate oxidation carrier complex protein SoxZ [Candidatus Methylospira mobilis]WNV03741.1 thiosulfate oxidation carrier complex protein SoxZ [Candidatus Methylospira mobilis]
MSTLKIRARRQDGYTLLRVLISHPMETGRRKTEQEQPIAAHYIRNVQIALNGALISECLFSTSVSRNPYLSLHLPASQPGDRLRVSWQDNQGQSDSDEVLVE